MIYMITVVGVRAACAVFEALQYAQPRLTRRLGEHVVNKIRLRQVERALVREYEMLLDLSDVASASEEQQSKVLRTRALAAEAIRIAARVTHADAAASVTDGTGDNGIDAVYVDEQNSKIFLVQSKWHSTGNGTIGIGEIHAFRQGFKDLTDESYDRFNPKIRAIKDQVSAALNDSGLVLEMIVVTTGSAQVSEDVQRLLDDLLKEMNQDEELLVLTVWGLEELRAQLALETGGTRVDLMGVGIENYGHVTEPYVAYYGVVDGATLRDWHQQHGEAVFSQNIRKALGSTAVNDSLGETISEAPEKFWYYNNGVTILCESINRRPKGASTRNFGEFDLRGASVVNGAQTVASIASALSRASEDAPIPKVWVRAISLEGCPQGFAADVTRATNTQNSVESRDFVSLDDEQLRLRTDFRLSLGKNYSIKRGEKEPSLDDGCSVIDAVVALACMQQDVSLAVIAKSAQGRLWDMQGRYYRQLFNKQTNAYSVWRAVQTMRQVEKVLRELQLSSLEGRPRAVIVQGNRVILWGVFKRVDLSCMSDPDFDWDEMNNSIKNATVTVYKKLFKEVERLFPNNYITSLFKNSTRCRQLAATLLGE